MGLNAIGAYGFLAKVHIGHAVNGDVAAAAKAADVDAPVSVQAGAVADLDTRIRQMRGRKGYQQRPYSLCDGLGRPATQDQNRARGPTHRRGQDARRPAGREPASRGDAAWSRPTPVRYLSALLGADNETVLKWFILAVALLLDPAAVLLLLAAARTRAP
jgi:hypothetical protein